MCCINKHTYDIVYDSLPIHKFSSERRMYAVDRRATRMERPVSGGRATIYTLSAKCGVARHHVYAFDFARVCPDSIDAIYMDPKKMTLRAISWNLIRDLPLWQPASLARCSHRARRCPASARLRRLRCQHSLVFLLWA